KGSNGRGPQKAFQRGPKNTFYPPNHRVRSQKYKMRNNIKLCDGTTDPEDHLSRFVGVANSGEWPMHVWCRIFQLTLDGSTRGWFERLPLDSINEWAELREAFAARFSVRRACFKEPHEITKIIRKANESLTSFKERWTVETCFIMGVPEVMKISSFMDSVKSPELAKCFSDKVPTTVNEMMERLDDFVRSEEAYAKNELPKGETGESHHKISLPSMGGIPVRSEMLVWWSREEMNSETVIGEEMHTVRIEQETIRPHTILQEENTTAGLHQCSPTITYAKWEGIPRPRRSTVISVNSVKDKKRKVRETTESWMNIPISFPTISSEDVSEEPLIIEAEVEGYLVRRVFVDEGSSVEGSLGIKAVRKDRARRAIGHEKCSTADYRTRVKCEPSLDPVCQKRKMFSIEKSGVVTNKMAEWVKAGIVHPVKYPTYISNLVLVKKGDGTWRMCIDFKNLNSACPKDYYPLPNIDCKVESVMGFKYKVFLDAYKGYHQIQMIKEDKEKNAFYTDQGTYCYTKMPFGLKNAGATYQRLVESAFQSQIGRNLEAYVDDMVIKSRDEKMLLADIPETFDNLKKINMKLNPKKCSVGVEEGKFLGYRERSLPFLNTQKNITKENKHEYQWTQEADEAFQQMKRLITELPSLTPPREKETLYAYLAVSAEAVSVVLLTDRKGRQFPVQFSFRGTGRNKGRFILPDAGGVGLVLIGPSGIEYTYALHLTFLSTNNEAEYEALLAGLRIARQMNISNIEVKVDSKLVASQINETYEASKDNMIKYLAKVREYVSGFKSFSIENIPRNMNQKADVLSKLASVAFNHLTKKCLEEGTWLKDKNKVRCLRAKIGQYTMKSGVLFKKGYLVLMMSCVGPLQANYVIREINMGSFDMHVGPRAVVRKAVRQGYYWPTMHEDAKKEVEKCDPCQIHAPIEAKPLVKITGKEVIRFAMDNIICRFRLPWVIVIDNEAQLVNDPFKSWCGRFEIHHKNTAVAHPQENRLVERENRSLMEGIKTLLERERSIWVDELPNVLRAHRTSIKQSNRETPFSLTYGSEAVIPAEIFIPTYRTLMIREGYNEEEMRLNLDLLQEGREAAAIREQNTRQKWRNITTRKFARQVSGQENSYFEENRQAGLKIRAS
nr:reverse transcriptase domain-containing protein [Tanacetum cinerariifolium]